MKTPSFINPELQKIYDDYGYVIIRNFLNTDEINELLYLFDLHYQYRGENSSLWNSLCDMPHEKSGLLSKLILRIVKPRLDEHLTNYVCPAATFLVKNPNPSSTINLHRDFSVQDEPEFSYQNIWLPIVDTTPENGQLFALRGSHKFFDYPLPHYAPWPYIEHEELLLKYCDVIDAKAGDLVIYGDKVLHGSASNITNRARPVIHFGLLHPQAKLLYYYLNQETNEVTVYEVPYSFFFENAWGNQDGRFPVFKRFQYNPPVITVEEITTWLESNVAATNAV